MGARQPGEHDTRWTVGSEWRGFLRYVKDRTPYLLGGLLMMSGVAGVVLWIAHIAGG